MKLLMSESTIFFQENYEIVIFSEISVYLCRVKTRFGVFNGENHKNEIESVNLPLYLYYHYTNKGHPNRQYLLGDKAAFLPTDTRRHGQRSPVHRRIAGRDAPTQPATH